MNFVKCHLLNQRLRETLYYQRETEKSTTQMEVPDKHFLFRHLYCSVPRGRRSLPSPWGKLLFSNALEYLIVLSPNPTVGKIFLSTDILGITRLSKLIIFVFMCVVFIQFIIHFDLLKLAY